MVQIKIIILIFVLLFPFYCFAEPYLVWEAAESADPDNDPILGYKIYYRTTIDDVSDFASPTTAIDVGNVLEYRIADLNLEPGKIYLIRVRAYVSNEVSKPTNTVTYFVEGTIPKTKATIGSGMQ